MTDDDFDHDADTELEPDDPVTREAHGSAGGVPLSDLPSDDGPPDGEARLPAGLKELTEDKRILLPHGRYFPVPPPVRFADDQLIAHLAMAHLAGRQGSQVHAERPVTEADVDRAVALAVQVYAKARAAEATTTMPPQPSA